MMKIMKEKTKSSNKGITLIALVITVIVMLILVGVTIAIVIEGGLFTEARRAATGTEEKRDKELLAASGVYGGKTIDEWVKGKEAINVGQHITYGGIDYIVFADNGDTVDLISADGLGSLQLGQSYKEGAEGFAEGAEAYNNAVNAIVAKCKEVTGLEVDGEVVKSIRSVGNENVKYTSNGIKGSDTTEYFTSTYMKANVDGYPNATYGDWFATYNSLNIKQGDGNFLNDYNRMNELGILNANLPFGVFGYWLASRDVYAGYSGATFGVDVIHNGGLGSINLCYASDDGYAYGNSNSYMVRPVVTLSSSAIK